MLHLRIDSDSKNFPDDRKTCKIQENVDKMFKILSHSWIVFTVLKFFEDLSPLDKISACFYKIF